MNTAQYLELINKHGDSCTDDWDVLAVSSDQSLFLIRDSNRLCYVSTPDMATMMPYQIALAEKMIGHFAGDSPIEEVQKLVAGNRMKKGKVVTVNLTDEDLAWLKSEDISSMVHSIESHS